MTKQVLDEKIYSVLKLIAVRLTSLRLNNFFSEVDIARQAGMSLSEYLAYEQGEETITLKGVLEILEVFSVEPADFFSDINYFSE